MPKLTIEVTADVGLVMTHVKVDGKPVACMQSLKVEDNGNELEVEAVFPDTDLGWANAELLHGVPHCKVLIASPVEEKK